MSKDKNSSEKIREQAEDDKATREAQERERFEKRWGGGKPQGPAPEGGKGRPKK